MVIVEGPDGAGKTRLVERLSRDLKIPVEPKPVKSDMSAPDDLWETIVKDIGTWPRKALYDRHSMISEFIYSSVYREEPRRGFRDERLARQVFYRFHLYEPTIILCLPNFETCWRNVNNDTDNEAVQDLRFFRAVYWQYRAYYAHHSNCLVWDYTDPDMSYKDLIETLIRQQKGTTYLDYRPS